MLEQEAVRLPHTRRFMVVRPLIVVPPKQRAGIGLISISGFILDPSGQR